MLSNSQKTVEGVANVEFIFARKNSLEKRIYDIIQVSCFVCQRKSGK